ncbi:Hypothetical predicted protein [Octopus vulgaris]|uniref:Uncharacterized protein n=1 Tax=Octopus vulgaris TaxID=6645 RepID=A0AA36B368_OCTVU|nr:Hypothetical predicted protein [Octopus vulgaris]
MKGHPRIDLDNFLSRDPSKILAPNIAAAVLINIAIDSATVFHVAVVASRIAVANVIVVAAGNTANVIAAVDTVAIGLQLTLHLLL